MKLHAFRDREERAGAPDSVREAVASSRKGPDFYLASDYCAFELGIVSVTIGLLAWNWQPLMIGLPSIGVALLAYRQLVLAVQALLHLGRLPLAKS